MSVRIKVDISGLRHLQANLMRDPAGLLAPLTAELAEQTLKQTESALRRPRVAPDGSPWVPRQRPEPHPLLEFEGKMRRSIGVRSLQETEAEIGTSGVSQIASVHQLGSTRARVPQRQFLGWGKRDESELAETASGSCAVGTAVRRSMVGWLRGRARNLRVLLCRHAWVEINTTGACRARASVGRYCSLCKCVGDVRVTLSTARAAAAQAIRDAATTAQVRRVLEVDVLHERQIPAIAKGLLPAHITTSGDSGPADVCVMASGRRASQAIGITAVLIILDRVDLDPELAGTGRGLAVHDVVAQALEGLPGSGLPRLFVESNVEQLPFAVQEAQGRGNKLQTSDPYVALHVYTIQCRVAVRLPRGAARRRSRQLHQRDPRPRIGRHLDRPAHGRGNRRADAGASEERRRIAVQGRHGAAGLDHAAHPARDHRRQPRTSWRGSR